PPNGRHHHARSVRELRLVEAPLIDSDHSDGGGLRRLGRWPEHRTPFQQDFEERSVEELEEMSTGGRWAAREKRHDHTEHDAQERRQLTVATLESQSTPITTSGAWPAGAAAAGVAKRIVTAWSSLRAGTRTSSKAVSAASGDAPAGQRKT